MKVRCKRPAKTIRNVTDRNNCGPFNMKKDNETTIMEKSPLGDLGVELQVLHKETGHIQLTTERSELVNAKIRHINTVNKS